MKINSIISSNLNRKLQNNNQKEQPQMVSSAVPFAKPSIGCISYPVNFGSIKSKFIFATIEGIHCPCCGKAMITRKKHETTLTERALSGPSVKAIQILSQFEESMKDVEKLCFQKIKQISKKEPRKDLQKILLRLRPESLKRLQTGQLKIINKINSFGELLSNNSRMQLLKITDMAKTIIIEDHPENQFRRKIFINNISKFKESIPENKIGDQIYEVALSLKNSENDLDSFIVKYSQRSSREIGQRLVTFSTIEHIKPHSGEGKSAMENYLSECLADNGNKGDMPLHEWLKIHPEMIENTKLYLTDIINIINQGRAKGYESYPLDVTKTLKQESLGKIDLEDWVRTKLMNNDNFQSYNKEITQNCDGRKPNLAIN